MPSLLRLSIRVVMLLIAPCLSLHGQYKHLSDQKLLALMPGADDTTRINIGLELVIRLQGDEANDSAQILLKEVGKWIASENSDHKLDEYYAQWGIWHEYFTGRIDSAEYYYQKAHTAARKNGSIAKVYRTLRALIMFQYDLDRHEPVDSLLAVAVQLSRDHHLHDKLCDMLCLQAIFYHTTGDPVQSTATANELKKLAFATDDPREKGVAFFEIGNYYWTIQDRPAALYYHLKALGQIEQTKDSSLLFDLTTDLSTVYDEIGEFHKASEFGERSLALIAMHDGHPKLPVQLNSLGWYIYHLNDFERAMQTIRSAKKAYELYRPLSHGIAYPLGNLGLLMSRVQQWDSAIYYSNKAIAHFVMLQQYGGVAEAYNNMAIAYLGLSRSDSALKYARLGLKTAEDAEDLYEQRNAYTALYKTYKHLKKFDLALDAYENSIALNDSLYNKDVLLRSKRLEQELSEERDAAVIQALELEDQLNKNRIRQQRAALIVGTIVFVVILLLLIQMYRLQMARKKAYTKLAQKHRELEESQKIVLEQHEQILSQKLQIEQQHKDILDSINFASRIQHALLKPEEHVNKALPPHFILFKPRDIVSGDCYWAAHNEPYLYVAAIDCTGHGVPGAMMSMLAIAFLNEIIATDRHIMPADLMNQLRDKVIKELGQQHHQESSYREGMDMSLVRLNLETRELIFSGANNPLWLIRSNEVRIVKGDKQGISYSDNMQPFSQHELILEPDDAVYIFSDGYPDQLGGPKGKKLKYSAFQKIVLDINKEPMDVQKQILIREFEEWRGEMEQVDDVCVIGLRMGMA